MPDDEQRSYITRSRLEKAAVPAVAEMLIAT